MQPRTEQGTRPHAPPDAAALESSTQAVHERVDSLVDAIRSRNLDQVMSHYLPDVVVYDLTAPLDVRGVGEYRKKFQRWFAALAGGIHYEMVDVDISPGRSEAVVHCLNHITGTRSGGARLDYWVRVTSGWKKVDGQWLIAHEHISMPSMM